MRQQFPTELINPYGEVLVIPSRVFQPGWEQALKAEGHRVFSNSYNGEASFFVQVKKYVSKPEVEKPTQNPGGLKRWPREDEERLMKMVDQKASLNEMAQV